MGSLVPLPVQGNLLDRLITYISPSTGVARVAARTRLLMAGQYTGARADRKGLKEWTPRAGSADSDSVGDLPALRARSRDAVRNIPIASGAANTAVTNVIGSGLVPRPQPDISALGITEEAAAEWSRQAMRIYWAWWDQADFEAIGDHGAQQDLVFRSAFESGDVFAVRRFDPRPGDLLGLKIQILEADLCSTPTDRTNDEAVVDGVELRRGRPDRYHFADRHPGDELLGFTGKTSWSAVPATGPSGDRMVLHLFRRLRPGQHRGVPHLAPIIEALKQLGRYTDAELMAAVVGGMLTVFIKTELGDSDLGTAGFAGDTSAQKEQAAAAGEMHLDYGAILDLNPGDEPHIVDPKRPNTAFEGFVNAVAQQIGVAIGIPFELLVMHFSSSYSASRAALLEAWKFFYSRRDWIAWNFCHPIYGWVMAEAVSRGLIEAPGFFSDPLIRRAWLECSWVGPSKGEINELQAVQAAEKRIATGISTIADETAAMTGGDWELNHAQRVKETRMRREAGLDIEPTAERVIAERSDRETDSGTEEAA